MSNIRVSVHMIVKESTHLAEQFLNACFKSLYDPSYPNEIVLVNNGSVDYICKLFKDWQSKFNKNNIDFKIIESDADNFRDLRNLCLKHTDPSTDFFTWADADNIYYPEDLDVLKNYYMQEYNGKVGTIYNYFYHCMIHPFQVQCGDPAKINNYTMDDISCAKDDTFLYHKDLEWISDRKVHEKLGNIKVKAIYQSPTQYVHMGYTKQEWRTCIKWLRYDMIQHGHVNYYKDENGVPIDEDGNNANDTGKPKVKEVQMPYFRTWRYPDNILWDRRKICVPFPNEKCNHNYLPEAMEELLSNLETQDEAGWKKFIDDLDGNDFYNEWVKKKDEVGSWRDTLDWVVEEAEKVKWGLV